MSCKPYAPDRVTQAKNKHGLAVGENPPNQAPDTIDIFAGFLPSSQASDKRLRAAKEELLAELSRKINGGRNPQPL